MYINYLKPILYFVPLAIIQLVIIPLISIFNIAPNLIFILIALYTLRHGQAYGMVLGFVLGFLFDIISGGVIGASMLSFTISSFVTGYFYSENKIEINTTTYGFVFIVFLCGSVNSFIYAAATSNMNFGILIFDEGLLPGIYTALFSVAVILFKPKERM